MPPGNSQTARAVILNHDNDAGQSRYLIQYQIYELIINPGFPNFTSTYSVYITLRIHTGSRFSVETALLKS